MNLSYLQVFLQSMGMEALIIGLYFHFLKKENFLKIFSLVFMVNACTHPTVIFIIMKTGTYLQAILLAELFAWLAEAVVYKKTISKKWSEALGLSLVSNLVSWQFGPWITYAITKLYLF